MLPASRLPRRFEFAFLFTADVEAINYDFVQIFVRGLQDEVGKEVRGA
jgi:hypothetical protein